MASPIIVEGPDGQEYEFPEGTSQEVMREAMRKRYSAQSGDERQRRGLIRTPTIRTPGKELPGVSEQVRDERRVLRQADQAFKAQQEEQRKAVQSPVEQRAAAAGREATLQGLSNTPAWVMGLGGPSATLAGQSAYEQEYDQAGIISPSAALEMRGLNSAFLGAPGLLNEDMRRRLGQAGQDQPGASLLGDIAGYLVPGEAAWQAAKAATNAFARPIASRIMPQGGSALERGTRFTGRYGTQASAWAGQNALYQGTVGESVEAAEEGRAPSLAGMARGVAQGGTDWINFAGPAALMGLNRLREYVVTGRRSSTPRSVAESVAAGRGAPTSGSILDAERVGGDVDHRAERILIRMLRDAGYSRDDIRRGLSTFDSLADQASDLPVLASRLKDVLIDQLGPGAERVVQDFLQGAGVSRGGSAGQAVQTASQQDYGRLSDFLEASANARLGQGSRFDTLTGARDEMTRIGNEGYERVFGAAPTNQAGMDDLRQALDFYAGSELASPLRQVAAGRMLNVEQMIDADPRRAAHWMQHTAGLRAQEAADAGNQVLARAYGDMRNQILRRLEADGVAPGYQQARMQYGDEFGIEQALNFGSRFFTRVQDSMGVRQMADDLRNLTPEQQEAALLSIRDELLRLAGRHREGAAPRLSQLNTEASLGGLETVVGERGGQLANDIRFIDERLARVRATDPGSNSRTTSNTEARAFADRAVSNPISRTIGNALTAIGGDAAIMGAGVPAPILSARAAIRGAGERMARGRQGKIDDVTDLLLQNYGATPRPGMPGDDMPALTGRGGGGAPPAVTGGGAAPVPASQQNLHAQMMHPNDIVRQNADGTATFKPGSEGERVAQSGFGFNPFGRKPSGKEPPLTQQDMTPYQRTQALRKRADEYNEQFRAGLAEEIQAMPAVAPQGSRAASQNDWTRAMKEAERQLYGASRNKAIEPTRHRFPGGADDRVQTYQEALAVRILASEGVDASNVIEREFARRPTNARQEANRGRAGAGGAVFEGVKSDLGAAGAGAFGGGVMPMPSTGDPGEDMRNRLTAMAGGAAVGVGARRAAGRGGSDAAGAGLGARRPRKEPTPRAPVQVDRQAGNRLGTRAADASAITMLAAGGPTAQADTGDPQKRLEELSQREARAQQLITEYEQGLRAFQELSVTEKQEFLRDNGFTGQNGSILRADGATGANTTYAINNYTTQIQEAIAGAQEERELFRRQINEVRVGMAERQENPPNPLIDKAAELGTYAAMIYGAHRLRGAATRGSQVAARRTADDANALLTRVPVPPQPPNKTLLSRIPIVGSSEKARIARATTAANKAAKETEERLAGRNIRAISPDPTSPDGLPTRTANLQEFDRRHAAGDFGPAGPIGRFMEPINSRVRAGDLGIIGAGAADAYIMEGMLEKTRADIAAEEARLDEARKANNGLGDPDRIQASNDRLEQLRKAETVQTILQRVGVGLMIGGTVGLAHGRYSRPQPRFEAANRERELIRLYQTPPPQPLRKPRGAATPKQKPPVTITRSKRTPKPANDND